jgi:DNA-binding beta-propeller fold protein YncE
MKMHLAASLLALACISVTSLHAAPIYHVAQTIPLGSPEKWDFIHFDEQTKRVFVAHATEVTVIDPDSGKVVGHVVEIAGAHDIAVVDGKGYADNGKSGMVTAFDLSTFKAIEQIPADDDADAMLYDTRTHKLLVANGDAHSLSIIDLSSGKRLANLALPGSPEMMAADKNGKVFVNIASANEIARVDPVAMKVDAIWKEPSCEAPHGLAIDQMTYRLFVTCHNAIMIVVNAANGKELSALPIGNGTDGAAFDPVRKLAFSSNRDGTLSVVAEKSPDRFEALGNVRTTPGARTMAIDPSTGRIFLVTGDVASDDGSHLTFKPGSARLIVLEPGK